MDKISEFREWLFNPPTDGPRATILIRLMAGGVFLWEGIMKFIYPSLGVGRFTKLGFPMPGATADFVAWVEVIGGILFILGWITRPAAIAFVIEMIVAMLSTKVSLYLGHSPLGMPAAPPQMGLGAVLHDIRADYAQIMCSLFLLIAGPGPLSLDARTSEPGGGVRGASLAAFLILFTASVGRAHMTMDGPARVMNQPDYFQQSRIAIEHKNYMQAEKLLTEALAAHPDDPDVLNLLGFVERKEGHLDEAFEYYQKALVKRPDFSEAREYLAEAHLQAALTELRTLQSYGTKGAEEAQEVISEWKQTANKL